MRLTTQNASIPAVFYCPVPPSPFTNSFPFSLFVFTSTLQLIFVPSSSRPFAAYRTTTCTIVRQALISAIRKPPRLPSLHCARSLARLLSIRHLISSIGEIHKLQFEAIEDKTLYFRLFQPLSIRPVDAGVDRVTTRFTQPITVDRTARSINLHTSIYNEVFFTAGSWHVGRCWHCSCCHQSRHFFTR